MILHEFNQDTFLILFWNKHYSKLFAKKAYTKQLKVYAQITLLTLAWAKMLSMYAKFHLIILYSNLHVSDWNRTEIRTFHPLCCPCLRRLEMLSCRRKNRARPLSVAVAVLRKFWSVLENSCWTSWVMSASYRLFFVRSTYFV